MNIPDPTKSHISWFKELKNLKTSDGRSVTVLEFVPGEDDGLMSGWASYFRSHYCEDGEIDSLRGGTGLSRGEYLEQLKFPDETKDFGPATRASDFSEILVADYLEYIMNYQIPRMRYLNKENRNSSPQGVDVLGFKFLRQDRISPEDELLTCEVKAALRNSNLEILATAFEGSKKDFQFKTPEALNALKQRLLLRGHTQEAESVERFQNNVDRPYKKISASAVVNSTEIWSDDIVTGKTLGTHPNSNVLLFAFRGNGLMDLAHQLYKKAHAES